MQVLKTLKKVAAIGTGVAMLGATLTGALALDLKDYPKPFVVDGVYDDTNVFVVGDSALAADTLAVGDITASMQFLAKTPVTTGGGTVTVTGGKSQKVPLGQGLTNSTYLDRALQDDDISTLFDGKINFDGTEYDTSEELQMCDENGQGRGEPFVATSLMTDDDYKRDVFLETGKDKIKYMYKFDKTININTATTTSPLEIDFLGKPLKLTNIASATQFTARVGDEYTLYAGDSVSVDVDSVKKTVKLDNVGTSNAVVNVDGVTKSISSGSTATVNGVEVTVDSVTSRTSLAESSAILVLGKQATETYADGDAYVGENTDDPNWVWDIAALSTNGTSSYTECGGTDALVLGVENDFTFYGDDDKPTGVGQCLELPNKYLSVCIDSLSVADSDYADYIFEGAGNEKNIDTAGCGTTFDSNNLVLGIDFTTTVSEGIELRNSDYASNGMNNVSNTVKTKEVFLVPNPVMCNNSVGAQGAAFGLLNVFYMTTDNPQRLRFYGAVYTNDTVSTLARLNHGNTKEGNGLLQLTGAASTTHLPLKLRFVADTAGDLHGGSEELWMNWTIASNLTATNGPLGATTANEAGELYWNPGGRWSRTDISTKDEDHRTAYGVVILDPKGNGGSQRVKLLVPNDLVYANIVVKGSSAKVTSGSTSYVPTKISPVSMVASQVATPTNYNLVVVGGPCANPLAESLFGVTCDDWAYDEGEALVKLAANGEKVALLVAGTSATDTRRAGKAVAAYDQYAFSGSEALVKGTTMTDITVEKPAAPAAEEPAAEEAEAEAAAE